MATFDTYGTYAAGSTNWVAPYGLTSLQVQVWAGGGGGGGTNTTQGGQGGGGGGYAIGSNVSGTVGSSYAIRVGSGGTASATGAGGAGQSSFFGGSLVLALGGTGGARGTTSTLAGGGAGSIGDLKYSGGGGFGNAGTFGGGGGGGAGSAAAGTNAAGSQGGAGGSGGGGAGGSATAIGTVYGGGGGGRRAATTAKAGAAGGIIIGYNVTPGTYDQKHYRFFSDDTSLNGAGTFVAEDTGITGTQWRTYRFRAETANTGGTAGTIQRILQWQGAGHAWQNITTTTTEDLYLSLSSVFADGDATTQRLTGVGTFIAGQGKESGSQTGLGTILGNNNIEDEWNFTVGTAAMAGSVYNFRVTNNGTAYPAYSVYGTLTAGTGPPPNAVTLDGANDYGVVNNFAALGSLTGNFTIEGWFNQGAGGSAYAYAAGIYGNTGTPDIAAIQTENGAPSSGADFNSNYVGGTNANGYTTDSVFPIGTWQHVAIVATGSAVTKMYRNGTEVAYSLQNNPSGNPVSGGTANIYLGFQKPTDAGAHFFNGGAGGFFRVWNRARTAAEIAADYTKTVTAGSETGLIANYNFTEGSGTSVANEVSGGSAMFLVSAPPWTFGPTLTAKTYTATPKMSTFTENFNSGTGLDLTKWVAYTDLGGTVAVTGGSLVLNCAVGTDNSWAGVYSVGTYDLTGDYAFMQLGTVAGGSSYMDLTLNPNTLPTTSDYFSIGVDIGKNQLQAFKKISSVGSVLASVSYDPSVHKWLKLRESSGTTYFDYSTDGLSWSNLHSAANVLPVTALHVVIDDFEYDPSSCGTRTIDAFNIAPSAGTSTFIGWRSLMGVGL